MQGSKQSGNDGHTGLRPGTNWPVGPVMIGIRCADFPRPSIVAVAHPVIRRSGHPIGESVCSQDQRELNSDGFVLSFKNDDKNAVGYARKELGVLELFKSYWKNAYTKKYPAPCFRCRVLGMLTSTRTESGRNQLSATQTNDSTQANTKKKQGGRLWNMSAYSTF